LIAFLYMIFVFFIYIDTTKIVLNDKTYSLTWASINFDWVWIWDNELKKISLKIKESKKLETLYLWRNQITSKWLSYLEELKNENIKVIDLSNNNIWDIGMKEFLSRNSFKVVDVSSNNLTDKSVWDFVSNNKTTYLSINRNNLTDEGFKDIIKNKNIEYLSIQNNKLTSKTLDYILSNTGSIVGLDFLRVKWNDFWSGATDKLLKIKKEKIFKKFEY
jgi:hypothetical protein